MRSSTGISTLEYTGLADCFDHLAARAGRNRPLATYRFQFHKDFRFCDALALIDYLDQLGISHLYASPILEARPGSKHGYDIVDHNRLNPELGGRDGFERLAEGLRSRSMGMVLDMVPNHMGIGNTARWWQDVLMNGRTSYYADFFDIDWEPLKPELHGKLLLPILGSQYGEELEQGRIELAFDNSLGRRCFVVRYYEHVLPLDPQTVPLVFSTAVRAEALREDEIRAGALRSDNPPEPWPPELDFLLRELRELPPHDASQPEATVRRGKELAALLPRMRETFGSSRFMPIGERVVALYRGTPGDPASFDRLHSLLEAQTYRLAHWRVSGEEINYRRFFDVNDLVGISMENPRVFAETHKLLRELLAEDAVQGVRIDHCDGLYNPYQYLVRLQMLYCASQCCGANPSPPLAENGIEEEVQGVFGEHNWMGRRPPLYAVVEKILEPGEDLLEEWPVDGTSGYDFLGLVNGIFIDRRSEAAFTSIYQRFLGEAIGVEELIYRSKNLIMNTALAGEVNVLTHMLAAISSADRNARDFTLKALRDAIRETIACFPVYRTYVDERGDYTQQDLRHVQFAIDHARRLNTGTASSVFDFLRDILLLEKGRGDEAVYRQKQHFVLKFQQLTGPVMAKGLEDTVCYVYNRFVSLNEVGSSPRVFGTSVPEFHARNLRRAQLWPYSMLCTSTHDTKRSEDVRARLNVLSEIPRQWSAAVQRWRRMSQSRVHTLRDGRTVPDENEIYLLYQTLAGMWPWDVYDPAQREDLVQRAQQYMVKAVHEAKVNLSWVNQDPEYVEALKGFIVDILETGGPRRENRLVRHMDEFARVPAYFGAINSLAQVLLRCTVPGAPDLYQGTELWDFSLVDPDNRRPVDYELRRRLLSELLQRSQKEEGGLPELCRDLLANFKDSRVKLWTIMHALRFRREQPEFFHEAAYVPVQAIGSREEHICAFVRVREPAHDSSASEARMLLVAVPRLACTLMKGKLQPPLGDVWENTRLELPANAPRHFENILTGEALETTPARELYCRDAFANFPVALLWGR